MIQVSKDTRKGIDVNAPVEAIVAILAEHGITIALMDTVFERVKDRVANETIVTTEKLLVQAKKF